MPDISKIKLPGSSQSYNIVDDGARELIASLSGSTDYLGITTTALTDGATTNPITIDGQSVTAKNGNITIYGNSEFIWDGSKWDAFGDLSTLGALAYKDTVTASSSSVTFSGGTTDKVLGSDATFTTTVTPETAYLYVARKNNVTVGTSGTDTFVKSYPGTTQKLDTTTVPNVTSAGAASTWSFAMGTGNESTTLIISGGNGTAPTLGTAKTVATGGLTSSGSGASVMTGLGTPTTGSAATGVEVTQQPTFSIEEDLADGDVEYVSGISSAVTTVNSKDEVTAVTSVGTATAAAQNITVS